NRATMLATAAGGGFQHWLDLVPGYHELDQSISEALGPGWIEGGQYSVTHIFLSAFAILVAGVLIMKASRFFAAKADATLTSRTFFELLLDGLMNLMSDMMGRKQAERFLPLIGTIAVFVFFSNVLALLPGFVPPTDNLN